MESGLVHGSGIVAISGTMVAMDVVDRSIAIWRSKESDIWRAGRVPDMSVVDDGLCYLHVPLGVGG